MFRQDILDEMAHFFPGGVWARPPWQQIVFAPVEAEAYAGQPGLEELSHAAVVEASPVVSPSSRKNMDMCKSRLQASPTWQLGSVRARRAPVDPPAEPGYDCRGSGRRDRPSMGPLEAQRRAQPVD